MDIKKNEVLIAEIEQFKEEALKMHIVQVLADSYTNTNLFDYNIDSDSSVIWYKAQARQLWDFWQATKTQVPEGFILMPKESTQELFRSFYDGFNASQGGNTAQKFKDGYKAMVEAQEEDAELNAIADSRKDQKRISVNIEDL